MNQESYFLNFGVKAAGRKVEMSTSIKMKVIDQLETLPENLQQQVLVFMQGLQSVVGRGVPGKQLMKFAGSIPVDDLKLMRQAIEDGCERMEVNEW